MAVPKETVWGIDPHTQAKHEILRRYLGAWFPILSRYNDRIVYIDGFSGPGRYKGGDPGSPFVALTEYQRQYQMNPSNLHQPIHGFVSFAPFRDLRVPKPPPTKHERQGKPRSREV